MRRIITISIPEDISKELDKAVLEEETSRSSLVKNSLRDFLWTRRFRSLRKKAMLKVKGRLTDQDIFDQVS